MPTYEYECRSCGFRFERQQSITETPLAECPNCRGEVQRLISGGAGFIIKGGGQDRRGQSGGSCSFNQTGQTCCGQEERCATPPCGERRR